MTGLAGVVLLIGSVVLLWWFLPSGRTSHRVLRVGGLSWTTPLLITSGIAFGITLLLIAILQG
jgi:hypothetical protein